MTDSSRTPATAPPVPSTSRGSLPIAQTSGDRPIKLLTSLQLFGDASEIEIEHGNTRYRLRKTALGKLIMTK